MAPRRAPCQLGLSLVCSPPSPPRSSSMSNLDSGLTWVRKPPSSSKSPSINSITLPSVTTLPPFHNGPALDCPSTSRPLRELPRAAHTKHPVPTPFATCGQGHDYILGRLTSLKRLHPDLWKRHFQTARCQYRALKSLLVEMNIEVAVRTPDPAVIPLCIPTRAGGCRISGNVRVCASSPVSIASRPQPSAPQRFARTRTKFNTHTHQSHISLHFPLLVASMKRGLSPRFLRRVAIREHNCSI